MTNRRKVKGMRDDGGDEEGEEEMANAEDGEQHRAV